MKNKIVALLLAGIMVTGLTVGASISAVAANPQKAIEKSETVHVQADAEGTVKEMTVSDWLKIDGNTGEIQDISDLTDIRNTEGDEEFRQDADGTIVWENKGEDISYEGKSTAELPVTLKVRYYLDGKEKSAEEMAGVSGKVKIRFEFENHTSKTVEVDGKKREVQIPFTAISAVMLPSDVFNNVEISNGKVIENEEQSIAAGLAFPGLKGSLKLADYEPTEKVDIPDFIEVTADAEKFELDLTATVISAGMFADMDLDDLDDAGELTENMETLTDASSRLAEGAGELAEGMQKFQSYMNEFTEGASALSEGAAALTEGLSVLNTEKTNLKQGASRLEEGLEALDLVLSQISVPTGLEQLFAAAGSLGQDAAVISQNLSAVQEILRTAGENLAGVDLTEAEQAATARTREQARSAVTGALDQMESLTEEQRQQILEAIPFENIDASGTADGARQEIADISQRLQNEAAKIEANLSENLSVITGTLDDMQKQLTIIQGYSGQIDQLSGGVEMLQGALGQLQSAVKQLRTGTDQLVQGITAYGAGVEQAFSGAAALSSGTNELLSAGGQLSTGFGALLQGCDALETGMITFNKEGIQNLSKLAGDDLNEVITRIKALKQADSQYQNFSGITEGTSGEVKFIIETEEIKK